MLEFFDGDGVEFFDAGEEVAVFFEVEGGGGGFAFKVGVVHKDGGQLVQDFGEPVGGEFLVPQEHGEW